VGKTELAKALAEFLFGNEEALIRIDMSEYMEKFSVSRLVGAPPGYVGYEEGGQLTERVRQKPYSVVLLDEIEKAHPDVFSLLLQIMDEGRLTDSWGHVVDFRNAVVILTSNIGTKSLRKSTLGFRTEDAMLDYQSVRSRVLSEMKKLFNPELVNRFDETIVFKSLTAQDIGKIVTILLSRVNERLADRRIVLTLSEPVCEYLIEKGYDSQFGARPLRRALQQYIEDPLSNLILEGRLKDGDQVMAILNENNEVAFKVGEEAEASKDPLIGTSAGVENSSFGDAGGVDI
jgi:ATP-dependent Clp protease ATP-binding subunit ClpC